MVDFFFPVHLQRVLLALCFNVGHWVGHGVGHCIGHGVGHGASHEVSHVITLNKCDSTFVPNLFYIQFMFNFELTFVHCYLSSPIDDDHLSPTFDFLAWFVPL